MSRSTVFIIAFWIFVGSGLIYELYVNYIAGEKEADRGQVIAALKQGVIIEKRKPKKPVTDFSPDVVQEAYSVKPANRYYFEAEITLANRGKVTARQVRILVRPFRGGTPKNDLSEGIVDESDPAAKIGNWVSVPDIGPGEKQTVKYQFSGSQTALPGDNPTPEIQFVADENEVAKAKEALNPPRN